MGSLVCQELGLKTLDLKFNFRFITADGPKDSLEMGYNSWQVLMPVEWWAINPDRPFACWEIVLKYLKLEISYLYLTMGLLAHRKMGLKTLYLKFDFRYESKSRVALYPLFDWTFTLIFDASLSPSLAHLHLSGCSVARFDLMLV